MRSVLVFLLLAVAAGAADPPADAAKAAKLKERESLRSEADKLRKSGPTADALAAANKLLAFEIELFGADHEELADTYDMLARIHRAASDWPNARAAIEKLLAVRVKKHGEKSWQATNARVELEKIDTLAKLTAEQRESLAAAKADLESAQVLENGGKFAEAATLTKKTHATYAAAFGEDSVTAADMLNDLAVLQHNAGDLETAIATFRQALAIRRKRLGDAHPAVALSLRNIGTMLADKKDYAAAETALREAVTVSKAATGENSAEHGEALVVLASVYRRKGELTTAKELLLKAVELSMPRLGDGKPDATMARISNQAGLVLLEMKDLRTAEGAFREAAEIWTRLLGAEHSRTRVSFANLAVVYERMLEAAKAAPADERPYQTLPVLAKLGRAQEAGDDAKGAEKTRAEAQKVFDGVRDIKRPVGVSIVGQAGHGSYVAAVTFAPDGKQFATAADDGIVIRDTASGREVRRLSQPARTLAFSPDGRWLVSANYKTAVVWEVATGRVLHDVGMHEKAIRMVAFSPNGKYVATASEDNTAQVWNVATGEMLRRFNEPNAVNAVAFTPDGERLLTANRDGFARVWQMSPAKLVHRLTGHTGGVLSVAVSTSGQRILTGGSDATYRLWDTTTGKEIATNPLKDSTSKMVSVAWATNGSWIVAACDNNVEAVKVADGKGIRMQRYGRTGEPQVIALSPDGTKLAAVAGHGVRVWDTVTRGDARFQVGLSDTVAAVAFAPDGRSLVAGSNDRTARLWDLRGRAARRMPEGKWEDAATAGVRTPAWLGREPFAGHIGPIAAVAYAPDGKTVATGGSSMKFDFKNPEGEVLLWDAATATVVRRMKCPGDVIAVAYAPDGKTVAAGVRLNTGTQSLFLWDAATGEAKQPPTCELFSVEWLAFSPDGRHLLATGVVKDSTGTRVWELETRKEVAKWFGMSYGAAFLPDGTTVLTDGRDGSVAVRDMTTGKVVRQFGRFSGGLVLAVSADGKRAASVGEEMGEIYDVAAGTLIAKVTGSFGDNVRAAFSPDGKLLAVTARDQSTHLFDAATGKHLCRLVAFTDNTFAVIDPLGRYDASNGGDIDGLHWVVGNEPIALSQLKERYYDPGLLAKHLGFNKEPLREVAAFTAPKLYPDVAAKAVGTKLDLTLTNRGGGIGRVVVLVNGKEATADARPRGADADAAKLVVQLDLTNDPRMEPGKKNRVEVVAYNAEGYLASRGIVRDIEPEGRTEEAVPPELWAVVAGVSDYRGDAIDLKFAAKDSDDFATAVRVAGNRLFGADRVHLTALTTTGGDPKTFPSRANLIRALEAIKKSKPGDVVLIYLAGHGVNHGGAEGDFYYLTSDAATANLGDPAVRSSTAVSSKELTEILKAIPAQKQVLILDTCASGKLVEKLTEKRDVPGSQVRALEQLKDRTGMYVLAGCASDAVSYEASRYGQGLLTYSLLLGMRGAALKDERVDVATLFGFAADKVPELARDIGGVQRPVVASPRGGQPFPIGLVTAADQANIPLQSVRPLLLRCNLQEEDEFKDVLDLGRKVDESLRTAATRGKSATLVFVDATELPDAHQLAGRYKIDGDSVTVTAMVFRGKERVGRVAVKGEKGKPAELAAAVAAEIEKTLKGSKP